MIRTNYQQALDQLNDHLMQMLQTTESSIKLMTKSLKVLDVKAAKDVLARDRTIDQMEREIEKKCIQLITTQQPVASDLREIMAILKMITDIQRIADQCEDVCKYIARIKNPKIPDYLENLYKMSKQTQKMFQQMVKSYSLKDNALAVKAAKMDDKVDAFFLQIIDQIIRDIKKNPKPGRANAYFILIAKYLERIADHTTNICAWIGYQIEGEYPLYQ